MSSSELDLILRTKREGDAPAETLKELNNMKTGLTDLEKTIAGTRTTIGGLDKNLGAAGQSVGSMSDMMDGMGLSLPITPMMMLGEAIQASGQWAKDSIADYSAYVDQISKMAAYASTPTEEMSKLYQVADDLRIPVGDLEMALKTMTTKGVTPSIDGLKALSDEYNSLTDPLERSQFLTDNFGRAGQEMGRLMEMGAAGIDEMEDSVENWMIVTGKTEEEIKNYLATQDRWEEAMDELKYSFAMNVTPAVTNFMKTILDTNDEINNSRFAWMRYIPVLAAVQELWVGLKNVLEKIKFPSGPEANRWYNTAYGGGRAEGGSVFPGQIYKVGERETEFLQVPAAGVITPGSAGQSVVVNINYQSAVSLGTIDEAERVLVPYIQAALRQV